MKFHMIRVTLAVVLITLIEAKDQHPVTFTLGPLGPITGVIGSTKTYPGAPHSDRSLYKFRNIPYAEPFERFDQPQLWNPSRALSVDPVTPYDATMTGPLCVQGNIDPEWLEDFNNKYLVQLALEINPLLALAIELLINLIDMILNLEPGIIAAEKTIGQILHDWLDVDLSVSEDCLHLAVSTPIQPTGEQSKTLPVMFFVHGGAFYAGTQIRMGAERFAAWNDVIVVSINYRVGPLGFMCLDSDKAAGNMGMLDMVTALEWVHEYIPYFGGDPDRITIFGESAGSAAIGHLLLSELTNGMFSQGIGQSGSALSSWAFDRKPEEHAVNIASKVGCVFGDSGVETHDLLVDCLRDVPAHNISVAFTEYRDDDRENGGMGFGGSIPCAQSKGDKMFYSASQTPESLLYSGQFEKVPIMFGANSHEGSFVYGVVYNSFFVPNNLNNDSDYLSHSLIHQLLETVEVTNSYPVEYLVESEYFYQDQMGDLMSMRPGIIDLLGAFFLKASSYEFLVESANQGSPAYWYSFEYAAVDKSVFHLLFLDPINKAEVTNPGVCHADELIYMFDVELPLLLCDLGQITEGLGLCLSSNGLDLNIACIEEDFRVRWGGCLTGQLTDEEMEVSGLITRMWTNFAVTGDPGEGAKLWSKETPWYSRINTTVDQMLDYRRSYHVASSEDTMTTPKNGVEDTSTTTTAPMVTTGSKSKADLLSVNILFRIIVSILAVLGSVNLLN